MAVPMQPDCRIERHPPLARCRELLAECGLPVDDLTPAHVESFLGCGERARPDGIVGLEIVGHDALLRSLAVTAAARGRGCGDALVAAAEAQARAAGVQCLYLLTTTAETYFAQRAYAPIERARVPAALRSTAEFASLCPDSAIVMYKALTAR